MRKSVLIAYRITYDIILCLSIFMLPHYISAMLIGVGAYFFDLYFEAIFAGFFLDSLYSPATGYFRFVGTVLGFVIFIASEYYKKLARK